MDKRKKGRKAQFKIQEMSFMLLFIILFFVLVFLFFIVIMTSGLKQDFVEGEREQAQMLISRVADTPELNCQNTMSCIDADKLIALKSNKNYENFWHVEGLVIEKFYPFSNRTVECNPGNYPNCNTFTIKKPSNNTLADASFVSLCRKESYNGYGYDKCEIAKVRVYSLVEVEE
jgi:hypothetical protein